MPSALLLEACCGSLQVTQVLPSMPSAPRKLSQPAPRFAHHMRAAGMSQQRCSQLKGSVLAVLLAHVLAVMEEH